MAKKSIAKNGKRKVVYCRYCCTEKQAIEYMGTNVYSEVPCKCRLRGWQKYLKENFKNNE